MSARRQFLRVAAALAAGEIGLRWSASERLGLAVALAKPALREVDDVSDIVRPIHDKHATPGLIGAIVDSSGLLAIGADGIRKAGARDLMTADDQIHLGSCTKAMTATLIGQLIERKRFSFDSTMRQLFPKFAQSMNEKMADVEVVHLLTHTAGLPANVDWWSYNRKEDTLPEQRLKIAKQVLSAPPEQAPGSKFLYSNVGYMLLGAIVEAKTGKSWEDVIAARLFKPLEMTSAGFGPPGTEGRVDQPWGHVKKSDVLEPVQHDNAPPLGPAGRVHCTMADWAKYVSWCLRVEHENTKILSTATQKQLLTPGREGDYAGGWIITTRPWAGGRTLTHAGSNNMWFCVAWLAPGKRFAVLAATNSAGGDASKACDELASALIARHAQRPRKVASSRTSAFKPGSRS